MMNARKNKASHPLPEETASTPEAQACLVTPGVNLKVGMRCPRCKEADIEYNGLLQLVCPNCGLTETGAST
jgi:hypothetical protein